MGPDRIEIYVGPTLEQVDIFGDQQALEPILPEMPGVGVLPLVGQGIAQIEPLHRLAQAHAGGRPDDEMHVVRHQAVVVEPDAVRGEVAQQQLAIALVVGGGMEHGGAIVSAREHMVTGIIGHLACEAGQRTTSWSGDG